MKGRKCKNTKIREHKNVKIQMISTPSSAWLSPMYWLLNWCSDSQHNPLSQIRAPPNIHWLHPIICLNIFWFPYFLFPYLCFHICHICISIFVFSYVFVFQSQHNPLYQIRAPPNILSTNFWKEAICLLSSKQFVGISRKSYEVFEYMSRPSLMWLFPPVYIGRFFNFIRGISPQRRNEMGVGSKLRDKSDLVSNRRHYIQTLPPRYVLLYRHTSKKGEF